ncbi:MAG: hypothetical protein O9283_03175 [Sphingomonadaceae bacterium]|jgi:hypothetical protein|nr:hypothetical protein [Sphingomonadaceae bacterium]
MLNPFKAAVLPLPNPGQALAMAWDHPRLEQLNLDTLSQLPAVAIVAVAGQQQVTQ